MIMIGFTPFTLRMVNILDVALSVNKEVRAFLWLMEIWRNVVLCPHLPPSTQLVFILHRALFGYTNVPTSKVVTNNSCIFSLACRCFGWVCRTVWWHFWVSLINFLLGDLWLVLPIRMKLQLPYFIHQTSENGRPSVDSVALSFCPLPPAGASD